VIGFWVERSKVKVIGLGLTVIRREIERLAKYKVSSAYLKNGVKM